MSQVQVTDSSHNWTNETDHLPMLSAWVSTPGGSVRRSRADAAFASVPSRVRSHLVAYFLYARNEPEEMRRRGVPSLQKLEQFPPMRRRSDVRIITYSARKNVPTLRRHPSRPNARIVSFSEGYAVVVRRLPPWEPSAAPELPAVGVHEDVPPMLTGTIEEAFREEAEPTTELQTNDCAEPETTTSQSDAIEAETAPVSAEPEPVAAVQSDPAPAEPDADDRPACKTCGEKFTPNAPGHKHCPKCFKAWLASQTRERKDERPPANAKPRQTERPAPPPQKTLSPMEQAQRDLRAQREQRAREDAEIRKAFLSSQPLPMGAKCKMLQLRKVAVVVYQGRSITVHLA